MQLKSYVYIYLDPRKPGLWTYDNFYVFNFEPFYVGKGKDLRWKPEAHKENIYLERKLKVIGFKNVKINFVVTNISENAAFRIEKRLISLIGRHNISTGSLLNMTDGGEGQSGLIHSDKTKEKMSKSRKGKKHSVEWIENRAKKLRGKKRPDQQRKRIRDNTPTKLNFQIAEDIRHLYINNKYNQYELADRYNVAQSTISSIINYKHWKHYK